MAHYDIFNGDADGILALHQLRLNEPRESTPVTGVKRDIKLLAKVAAARGDSLTVLDISLDSNRNELSRLLDGGATIEWFDHHFAGDIPDSPALTAHIDTSADTCTSLIVNAHLGGRYLAWAVAAAFGDNLEAAARKAAEPLGYSSSKLAALAALGTSINYNGYGVTIDDLYFSPEELYRQISQYVDPFAFIHESAAFGVLKRGVDEDMSKAAAVVPELEEERVALHLFPDAPWARRVSGVFGNDLASRYPGRAHALATLLPDGCYRISVRAPLADKRGADELCMRFPTGGGRKGAAGINALPPELFASFIDEFRRQYAGQGVS